MSDIYMQDIIGEKYEQEYSVSKIILNSGIELEKTDCLILYNIDKLKNVHNKQFFENFDSSFLYQSSISKKNYVDISNLLYSLSYTFMYMYKYNISLNEAYAMYQRNLNAAKSTSNML